MLSELHTQSLKRSLLLGLGWVCEHLQQFAINKQSAGPFSKEDVARLKPASELALTVWLLERCGISLPALKNVSDWVWQQCDNGDKIMHLLLARNDFLPCCTLYASMFQLGYYSANLHAAIRMLSRSNMAAVLPLQPWAYLALQYNLWKLELLPWSKINTRNIYIKARPEPWVISGEIAYTITHEVFYLSDFGFRPMKNLQMLEYLRTWTPYWTNIFIQDSDDDITGEFAIVSSCIDKEMSYISSLDTVLSHQHSDGSVKGPAGAGGFLYSENDSPTRREFLGTYHTTLVMLMAAALTLRRAQLCTDSS
ncbi:DUF6895 family protein [Nitrosospira sp. Is2]|uniref:DUF6895 family protein n=1 Tax=Nitrosospira sp. Is2 TaxID=3080532 RepID=UPI00295536DC|nr:hypothetical protein [Nitrosospira sp. Is2]WON74462.1 hypothetical protein R5L00_02930 [Nitrosospira sp. Is2]